MRIACIHVPQFALQCATRLDPSLRGAPIAVVSGVEPGRERAGVLHAPVVLACSRAAWALGVRLGMTATAARSQSTDLVIVTADAAAERETVRAIADAVLAFSSTVDLGGRVGAGGAHLAMYAEVPAKTRGTSFGDRLVELLSELGLSARIGIADDRFTAWVAAAYGAHAPAQPTSERRRTERGRSLVTGGASRVSNENLRTSHDHTVDRGGDGHDRAHDSHDHHEGAVVNVPRGGSAAFLAPRPLSLLAIPSEVQHMLEALGVRTLGEFASLPAPSVARPLEADYQALARGESGATLRPYHPEAPIREEIIVTGGPVLELAGSLSGPAAIALVARRISLRLAGRGRGAARLDVTAIADGDTREMPVTIDGSVLDAEELARVLAPVLDAAAQEVPALANHGGWRLRVVVSGEAIATGEAMEVMAEGSSSYVRTAGARAEGSRPFPRIAESRAEQDAGGGHSGGDTARAEGTAPFARAEDGELFARVASEGRRRRDPDQTLADVEVPIHPLSVVLSSSGSLFALAPPTRADDRRDVHRRTRRGKQRRSRPTPQAQPRLFDRASNK